MFLRPDKSPVNSARWRNSARYGIPLLLAVFYATASFYFSYTPDSTFGSLVHIR
ncbi:MAG: hypothetical protein HY961_17210, partial [Ignavibacteriae bacterium]|nr:hypothetical protein [Ignavibacteriota bacterium]